MSAGLDSAYDDNVYNSRGPDFVNRMTPHASYRLIDPRVKLEPSYDFGYWTYALGKADNSLNHRADVSVEGHPTRRLTLQVGRRVLARRGSRASSRASAWSRRRSASSTTSPMRASA